MKFLRSIGRYMRPYRKRYILGIFALIAVDVTTLYVPQILRRFANDYQAGILTQPRLIRYALWTIAAGLAVGVGRFFWRIYIFGNGRKIEYDLRRTLFGHWLSMDRLFYTAHKTGDLMAYATNDINAVRSTVGEGIMMGVDSTFMLLFTIAMMISTTGARFTFLTLLPVPMVWVLAIVFGKVFFRRFRAEQKAYSDLSDVTQENFSGIRVIKAFTEEPGMRAAFDAANRNYYARAMAVVRQTSFFFPFMVFLTGLSFLIMMYFGARDVISGRLLLGDFVAHYTYLMLITWPIRGLGMLINLVERGAASLSRIDDMLAKTSTIEEASSPTPIPHDRAKVEFRHVTFTYPGMTAPALRDVSFLLEDGRTLAVIGKTGSGKSTIPKLLFREYDIDEGEILIDDVPIRDISRGELAEKSGYVPQENFLFSEALDENIAFAFDESPGDEEILASAEKSGVYADIAAFSDGFKTVIGERGATLSGGQQQRVSIARALIKKPRILVLDDALSAVDTGTEKKILDELREVRATTLVIAHRISTIKQADEILFMKDGRVAERGTHEELIAQNGEYKWMYDRQLLEAEMRGGVTDGE